MYLKLIFIVIDILAVVTLYFAYKASSGIKKSYGKWLTTTLFVGMIAIMANILIALSTGPRFADIAFCLYFSAIDWLLYYLVGFCLDYTEHRRALDILKYPAAVIIGLDTLSILLNPVFGHAFTVYSITDSSGVVFYQTGFLLPYYIHLAIDYTSVAVAFFFIIFRIVRSYSFYRVKYVIILSVLLLVVLLNVAYMMFALPLDASVIFYAIAGTLIYFSIHTFVPQSLMTSSIGRVVDDMNEGLILFDIQDNCIYANAFARKRFDIDPDSFDLTCEPLAGIIRSLNKKGLSSGKETYCRADGDERSHYIMRYNLLSDAKNRRIGSYCLIEDNTEQVHYLDEISAARDAANEASSAKSTFLAHMSHEIRTPLNSVIGMNEMILRTTDDPTLREYAENIKISGETLLGLISDILDFSKIEARKVDVVLADYAPHDLLRDMLNHFEQMADAKDLYIRTQCDETVPSMLSCDRKLLAQIMTNIISNAVKYTKEGGISINMSGKTSGDDTYELTVSVSDTGLGIAKDDIPYLFDAFKRVNEKENASIQGTGLGLAITHDLVTLLGGTIDVVSEVGKGSTFTVVIPQKIVDAKPSGPFVKHIASTKDEYRESFRAPDARILVVDDSSMNLKVVKALLRKTQIAIDTADGGMQAVEMCRENKYDLILLDHRMPDPDGIATFHMIRSGGMNTDVPVIMLTANVVSGAEDEYIKIGFSGYLSKPIRGQDLEDTVRQYLPAEKII